MHLLETETFQDKLWHRILQESGFSSKVLDGFTLASKYTLAFIMVYVIFITLTFVSNYKTELSSMRICIATHSSLVQHY